MLGPVEHRDCRRLAGRHELLGPSALRAAVVFHDRVVRMVRVTAGRGGLGRRLRGGLRPGRRQVALVVEPDHRLQRRTGRGLILLLGELLARVIDAPDCGDYDQNQRALCQPPPACHSAAESLKLTDRHSDANRYLVILCHRRAYIAVGVECRGELRALSARTVWRRRPHEGEEGRKGDVMRGQARNEQTALTCSPDECGAQMALRSNFIAASCCPPRRCVSRP